VQTNRHEVLPACEAGLSQLVLRHNYCTRTDNTQVSLPGRFICLVIGMPLESFSN